MILNWRWRQKSTGKLSCIENSVDTHLLFPSTLFLFPIKIFWNLNFQFQILVYICKGQWGFGQRWDFGYALYPDPHVVVSFLSFLIKTASFSANTPAALASHGWIRTNVGISASWKAHTHSQTLSWLCTGSQWQDFIRPKQICLYCGTQFHTFFPPGSVWKWFVILWVSKENMVHACRSATANLFLKKWYNAPSLIWGKIV